MQNTYKASIDRARPGCLVFLTDMSGSMAENFDVNVSKASFVVDAINRTITEIGAICQKPTAMFDYFDIGLFVYGNVGGVAVSSALPGALAGRDLAAVSQLYQNRLSYGMKTKLDSDGDGGVVEKRVPYNVFLDVTPNGATPTCAAFGRVGSVLSNWCADHRKSFPPIVLHITDGDATDGSPEQVEAAARSVTSNQTDDGEAILLNLHVSGHLSPVRFPHDENQLSQHKFARALFRSSTVLPPPLLARLHTRKYSVQPGSRGYVFNGTLEDVGVMCDVGSKGVEVAPVAGRISIDR